MGNDWYGIDMFVEWKNRAYRDSRVPENRHSTSSLEWECEGTNEEARPVWRRRRKQREMGSWCKESLKGKTSREKEKKKRYEERNVHLGGVNINVHFFVAIFHTSKIQIFTRWNKKELFLQKCAHWRHHLCLLVQEGRLRTSREGYRLHGLSRTERFQNRGGVDRLASQQITHKTHPEYSRCRKWSRLLHMDSLQLRRNVHFYTSKFLFRNRENLIPETSNPGLICKVFKRFSSWMLKPGAGFIQVMLNVLIWFLFFVQ
jgi:hypothetical protein